MSIVKRIILIIIILTVLLLSQSSFSGYSYCSEIEKEVNLEKIEEIKTEINLYDNIQIYDQAAVNCLGVFLSAFSVFSILDNPLKVSYVSRSLLNNSPPASL